MAFNYSPKIVTNGLTFYLDAANPRSYPRSGNAWININKVGNNGALVNGPTFDSTNEGSIVLDGTDDYVSLGTGYFITTTTPFTANFWFNINKRANDFQRLFTLDAAGTGGLGVAYKDGAAANGYDGIYITSSSGWIRASTGQQLTSNIWRMLTFVYNGAGSTTVSNFSMYLNASLLTITSTGTEVIPPAANNNLLGARFTTSDVQCYPGKIASNMIYNRVLSATEVLQNYNATRTRFGL